MKSKKRKISMLLYLSLSLIAVLFILPPICLFVSSFKTSNQISVDMSNIFAFLPHGRMSLENYFYLFGKLNVGRFFLNSLVSSAASILLAVLFNAMMGFALGMLKFRGKGFLISLVLSLLIVPSEAVIVNKMIVVNAMGLIDHMLALILPFMATPFYIFLFYQHFKDMPFDLMEAAVMDGCSYPQIFFKIMLPLSKPVIATVSILLFIKRWGDLAWPSMVTRSNAIKVLPLALQSFYGDMNDWGPIFAMGTVMTVPVMIIFVLFQKQFIQSIAMSGIKG